MRYGVIKEINPVILEFVRKDDISKNKRKKIRLKNQNLIIF